MHKAITILLSGALVACGLEVVEAPLPEVSPIQAQSKAGVARAFQQVFRNEFSKRDTDKDGFLSAGELPNAPQIDEDKDGKASLKEYLAHSDKNAQDKVALLREEAQKLLAQADTDHNKAISLQEYGQSEAGKQMGIWGFRFGDRNKDQKLTLSEFEDVLAWQIVHSTDGSDVPAIDTAPIPKPVPTATPGLTPEQMYWYNPNQMGYGVNTPYNGAYGSYQSSYGSYAPAYGGNNGYDSYQSPYDNFSTSYGPSYGNSYGSYDGYDSSYRSGYNDYGNTGYSRLTYSDDYGNGYDDDDSYSRNRRRY